MGRRKHARARLSGAWNAASLFSRRAEGPERPPSVAPTGAGGRHYYWSQEHEKEVGHDDNRPGPQASVASDMSGARSPRRSPAVLSQVTLAGEPRSSGVLYKTIGQRLHVAVGADSWKARHISANRRVAVTVPVRRGGILSLVAPIPPATIKPTAPRPSTRPIHRPPGR